MSTITALAAAAEGESEPNPLLPENYDLLWSVVVFGIIVTYHRQTIEQRHKLTHRHAERMIQR